LQNFREDEIGGRDRERYDDTVFANSVGSRRPIPVYLIDVTLFRDSEHPRHMSAVDETVGWLNGCAWAASGCSFSL